MSERQIMMVKIMRENGISQQRLSRASGVAQSTISRIENGIGGHRKSTMLRLARSLGWKRPWAELLEHVE